MIPSLEPLHFTGAIESTGNSQILDSHLIRLIHNFLNNHPMKWTPPYLGQVRAVTANLGHLQDTESLCGTEENTNK